MPTAPPTRADIAGVASGAGLVAATYVSFLLFAQFAFLTLTKAAAPSALPAILGAQGLAGITGSVLAAVLFRPARAKALIVTGLLLGALAAALAPFAGGSSALVLLAALTGLALGAVTVTLASTLRGITGPAHLGLACGLGTGAAYALCTVPPVFEAAPTAQSWLAAAAAFGGAAVAWSLRFDPTPPRSECHLIGDIPVDAGERPGAWGLILFAFVAFDSAAFYLIQHTPVLKAAVWSDTGWLHGAVAGQVLAGVSAGLLLDRGRRATTVLAAILLLAGAVLFLARPAGWICVPYAAGVALYSTALVHYPALAARPGLAARIYAVCGWGGSAVGIGFAQGRSGLPAWLALMAAAIVLLALFLPRRTSSVEG